MVACGPSVKEVSGEYRMSHSEGVEVLVLSIDKTYTQTYTSNGRTEVNKGTWRMEMEKGFTRVYLQEWMLFSDPYKIVGSDAEGKRSTFITIYDDGEIGVFPDLDDYTYRRIPAE